MNGKLKSISWVFYVLAVVLIMALWLFLGVYNPVKYPLEFTAQQNVLREPSIFRINESVDVEAIFTNTAETEVIFTANVFWVLETRNGLPSDYTDPLQIISVRMLPGCHYQSFNNNAPPKVVEITKKLFAEGHEQVTWHLSGQNIITLPKKGGSKDFIVDKFTYLRDDIPIPKSEIQYANLRCD